ncbi:MAG: DinB family protein [Ktedonobacterales bacterium]|nr:DinB family protein [Ktedonobacterales bacterium]
MSKADFLGRMRTARQALETAIAGLTEDQLAREIVAGEWTTRDIVAHITAWDTITLEGIQRAARGERVGDAFIMEGVDAWNIARADERRSAPLADVLSELAASRTALLAALERWPEDHVPLGPAGWDETARLWWLTEHDDEHARDIAAWRTRLG